MVSIYNAMVYKQNEVHDRERKCSNHSYSCLKLITFLVVICLHAYFCHQTVNSFEAKTVTYFILSSPLPGNISSCRNSINNHCIKEFLKYLLTIITGFQAERESKSNPGKIMVLRFIGGHQVYIDFSNIQSLTVGSVLSYLNFTY